MPVGRTDGTIAPSLQVRWDMRSVPTLLVTLATIVFGSLLLPGCSDVEEDQPLPSGPEYSGNVHRVPSEFATLQAAIDFAGAGDTILVAPGRYTGDGNRDIYLSSSSLAILSENGPAETILDLQGGVSSHHFGFGVLGLSDELVIGGFTFTNGYAPQGTAIFVRSSSPTIRNCIFDDNQARTSGGAVRCKGSSPRIVNCTFVNNSATVGGSLQVLANSSPIIERCIFAGAGEGGAIYSNESSSVPQLSCCLVYGNTGGDWVDRIADQATLNGNLETDPLYCEPLGDFHLTPASPCLPANNACGELIGALGLGCR